MSISFTVQAFVKDINSFEENLKRNIYVKLREWGLLVRDTAKMNAPYDTGNLERNIQSVAIQINDYIFKVIVSANTEYARIQELGGVIRPKNATMLAWVTEGERPTTPEGWRLASKQGRARFAKEVYIPSQPYMYPAFRYNENSLAVKISEAFLMSGA